MNYVTEDDPVFLGGHRQLGLELQKRLGVRRDEARMRAIDRATTEAQLSLAIRPHCMSDARELLFHTPLGNSLPLSQALERPFQCRTRSGIGFTLE